MTSEQSRPPVGSVAEEAAKLAEALSAWGSGEGIGSWSTGSAECCICPVCRTIAALRASEPTVVEHLGEAVSGLRAALRTVADAYAATAAPTPPQQDTSHEATPPAPAAAAPPDRPGRSRRERVPVTTDEHGGRPGAGTHDGAGRTDDGQRNEGEG